MAVFPLGFTLTSSEECGVFGWLAEATKFAGSALGDVGR